MQPGRISRIAAVVMASGGMVALPALPVAAACKMPGDPLGPAVLAGYVTRPPSVLVEHPLADTGLGILAAQLATASPDAFTALISVVPDATDKQRAAIGAGLAAAANTCTRQDSAIVQRINDAVKKSGSAALQRAFLINYDIGPTNAASAPASSAAKPAQQLPEDLTLPKLKNERTLPDPFGPPEGWR